MTFTQFLSESAIDDVFRAVLDEPDNRLNYLALADAIMDAGDAGAFGERLAQVAQRQRTAASLSDDVMSVHVAAPFVHVSRPVVGHAAARVEIDHLVVRGSAIRRVRSRWHGTEGGALFFHDDDGLAFFVASNVMPTTASQFRNKQQMWNNGSPRDFSVIGAEERLLLLAGMAELSS